MHRLQAYVSFEFLEVGISVRGSTHDQLPLVFTGMCMSVSQVCLCVYMFSQRSVSSSWTIKVWKNLSPKQNSLSANTRWVGQSPMQLYIPQPLVHWALSLSLSGITSVINGITTGTDLGISPAKWAWQVPQLADTWQWPWTAFHCADWDSIVQIQKGYNVLFFAPCTCPKP